MNVHLVTASITASQNVVTAADHAGVEVLGTVYEPLAAADACLTADERELGVALVDIGGGTTDMIVYRSGVVRHSAVIPSGGRALHQRHRRRPAHTHSGSGEDEEGVGGKDPGQAL